VNPTQEKGPLRVNGGGRKKQNDQPMGVGRVKEEGGGVFSKPGEGKKRRKKRHQPTTETEEVHRGNAKTHLLSKPFTDEMVQGKGMKRKKKGDRDQVTQQIQGKH